MVEVVWVVLELVVLEPPMGPTTPVPLEEVVVSVSHGSSETALAVDPLAFADLVFVP